MFGSYLIPILFFSSLMISLVTSHVIPLNDQLKTFDSLNPVFLETNQSSQQLNMAQHNPSAVYELDFPLLSNNESNSPIDYDSNHQFPKIIQQASCSTSFDFEPFLDFVKKYGALIISSVSCFISLCTCTMFCRNNRRIREIEKIQKGSEKSEVVYLSNYGSGHNRLSTISEVGYGPDEFNET